MTTLERMNPLDAWFLYAEEDGVNHMNILSFIVLDGPPPPYEELLNLVASKLPQLPRYRQVIRTVPLPRRRRTILWPRVSPRGAFARTIRTPSPSSSKSTSAPGSRPAFSRISTGMVT